VDVVDNSLKINQLVTICQAPSFQKTMLPLPSIEFVCGDVFEVEWWHTADVVYAASLLFSDRMMERLTARVRLMKQGAWCISLMPLLLDRMPGVPSSASVRAVGADSESLDESEQSKQEIAVQSSLVYRMPVLKHASFFKMSWQMAMVYIYQIT
jgi:hypothetical protein